MKLEQKQLAGCVIWDEEGRLLLLHRDKNGLVQWELPGGKQDPGESLEQTAIRETSEEAGVEVEIVKKLGKANFVHNNIDWSYTWFEAKIVSGAPKVLETDTFDDLGYFFVKDLKIRDDISPNLVNLFERLGW